MSSGKHKLYHNQKNWQGCCVSHVSDAWQKYGKRGCVLLSFLFLSSQWPPQLSRVDESSHHRVKRKSSVDKGFRVGLGVGGELSRNFINMWLGWAKVQMRVWVWLTWVFCIQVEKVVRGWGGSGVCGDGPQHVYCISHIAEIASGLCVFVSQFWSNDHSSLYFDDSICFFSMLDLVLPEAHISLFFRLLSFGGTYTPVFFEIKLHGRWLFWDLIYLKTSLFYPHS